MPLKSPGPGRCATGYVGWLETKTLPNEYETKSVAFCFAVGYNDCYARRTGKVTNCKDYYVYYLPATPGCDYRYCATSATS